jgi:hypothetical protein
MAVIRSNEGRVERVGQRVTFDVVDIARVVMGSGGRGARMGAIDSYDFGYQLAKLSGQCALSAADVERAPAAGREGVKDH